MAKRIGEVLVEKGVVTPEQLEIALKNQLILGGHLGTCLVELGFLAEEELGRTLSEVVGVPYAQPSSLRNVEERVARALPKRLVAEYRVVPIALRDNSLHVAMVDPKDLRVLDVLAFGSGYRITPWIAPEVRIVEAMERFYDIPRTVRYIAIARAMDRSAKESSPKKDPSASIVFGETYSSGTAGEADTSAFDANYGYGRSWIEIAEELSGPGRDDAVSGPIRPEPPRHRPEAPGTPCTLAEVSGRLCAADDRDEIARAVLDYASATMPRSLLLAVRNEKASVWAASGFPPAAHGGTAAGFPIHGPGIFDLLRGNEHYHGPLAGEPRYRSFYETLGAEPPVEIFLAPVHHNDRLVALLLGDGGPRGRIEGDTEDYLRLARMLALSLSLLVLKKKIRAVESFVSPGGRGDSPRIIVAPRTPPAAPPSDPRR